jgi:hypothetical protein
LTKQNTDDIIKTVKERKQNKKRGRITVMKLYEINEGFEGTQEEAIAMGEYHEIEATKEEVREYAMYGLPNPDMQFLF